MANTAIPSLDGASLRVERAVRHFDEFERVFRNFQKVNLDKVAIDKDPSVAKGVLIRFEESLVIPAGLSLPVSDCIHNLRAALDYLVFELAFLDTKTVQSQTQFPIVDTPEDFNSKRTHTHLRGLSDRHVQVIESFQPYRGTEWTRTLRTISNPDKHRRLVPLKPQRCQSFFAHSSGDVGDVLLRFDDGDQYVKKEDVLYVAFDDSDLPVLETLNDLIVRVGTTIQNFQPDFR